MASEGGLAAGELLEILVFDLGAVACGIDGELVSRMLRLEAAQAAGMRLRWLHPVLPDGDGGPGGRQLRVVTLKAGAEGAGLVIEQPRDLLKVPLAAIRPLPAWFERTPGLEPFWGALPLAGQVVLLLDPHKLPQLA